MADEDDFHSRLTQCSRYGPGRRMSDPMRSPGERAALATSGEDRFHRRIAEQTPPRQGGARESFAVTEVPFGRISTPANSTPPLSAHADVLNSAEEYFYLRMDASVRSTATITEPCSEPKDRATHNDDKTMRKATPKCPGIEARSISACASLMTHARGKPAFSNGSFLSDHNSSSRDGTQGVASVVSSGSGDEDRKRRKIIRALDNCSSTCSPGRKKLLLERMNLTPDDVPVDDLLGSSLGVSLKKLSLSGNSPLRSIPRMLVHSLPSLETLDLPQCELRSLPSSWNLPKLTRLNLSNNQLNAFPEECIFAGLPALNELNLYGNKVAEIALPKNTKLLSNLEKLDLGYNDIVWLPDDLDQLKSLRTLKVMHNFLTKVPMRVCAMKSLKRIDVSSNPVTEPPIEICDRGIRSMRKYWHCIHKEVQHLAHLKLLGHKDFLIKRQEKSTRSTVCEFAVESSTDAFDEASP